MGYKKTGNNSFYADWEISLTYDKNRNLLTNLTEGYDCINNYIGKETYSYNAWGQLVNYNNDVGETASYTYYSDGLRASKTIGTIQLSITMTVIMLLMKR